MQLNKIYQGDCLEVLNNREKVKKESIQLNNEEISRNQERSKMSPLRQKLAERLVSVKNETAMLTTFNEIDMLPIIELRKNHNEAFKEKHGASEFK